MSRSRFAPAATRRSCLSRREVAPRLALPLLVAVRQRRLADEEVGVSCELGEPPVRPAVPRVREHRAVRRDAEAVGLELVVEHLHRRHFHPRGLERRPAFVLVHVERLLEHLRAPEPPTELGQEVAPSGGTQSSGAASSLAGSELRSPDPRHDVAPMVEMPVRDRDRVDARPVLPLAQPREHAGPAIEQQAPSRVLDEIARLRAARVRPGGRAPHDSELHLPILAQPWQARSVW